MPETENSVTLEQFKALRARFHGKMTLDEAMQVLRGASADEDLPPILRLHIASAMLDLRTGRSVQGSMARLRRAAGLDPAKKVRQE